MAPLVRRPPHAAFFSRALTDQQPNASSGVFWNFAPLNVRAQNASIFDLPSACTLPCPAVAQAILAENDPMIRLALAAHGRL